MRAGGRVNRDALALKGLELSDSVGGRLRGDDVSLAVLERLDLGRGRHQCNGR